MTNGANTQTADLLKNALRELKTTRKRIEEIERKAHEPIAVVGMGCRFPGSADSPEKLWNLLDNGVDAIIEMKDERWVADDFYDPNPEAAGKLYTKALGLVDAVDQFDPEFFNIAPVEAKLMEPQQRLLLESAWHALEHAGIAPRDLNGSKTGVFVGICHQGYAHMQARYCEIDAVSPYDGTGNAHAVASGRISYIMGLQGPSVSIDTACSSSLVAIHLAVQSLRSGESDMALAGGVNLILEPTTSMIFARAGMLAPDGRCKTFDAEANGYVRSEGCGMVVLKRLSDAQRDGDRILAVVRGSAVNQDGTSQGITAPNELAQEKVIRAALADAQLTNLDVSYVEAHGTGTSLGDPIELSALNTVYGPKRTPDNKLIVGSIKTNMGHSEGAAGVLGFMKLVLALQHRTIPAHLHFKNPNTYIDWNTLAIKIPAEKMAWESNGPLTGGLSSFGFSGTNSHIIVQEAPAIEGSATEVKASSSWLPLNLSAKSDKALDQLLNDYAQWMEQHADARWPDIAYTASAGRNHFRHRVSLIADSRESALAEIKAMLAGQPSSNVKAAEVRPSAAKLGFMFTGQGAQYIGMGKTLYETHGTFRTALDECAQKLAPLLDKPLLSILWGEDAALINQTQYTQPAIFSLQYALTQWWASLGVTPAAVTGHSIGEYAAAVAAGVMSLDDAITLIAARGRLMAELCEPGAMLAVFADQTKVENLLREFGTQVSIAAINGPNNIVLAGAKGEIEQLQAVLSDEGVKFRALTVSHAFHSYLMEPMLDSFREIAQKVTFKQPRITFISSKTGETAGKILTSADYWVDHISDAVQFLKAARTLGQQKLQACLEIGPGNTLVKLAQQGIEKDEGWTWVASLEKDTDELKQVASTAAALYVGGADIKWQKLFPEQCHKLELPVYPYQRQSYWVDAIRVGNYSPQETGNLLSNIYHMSWLNQAFPTEKKANFERVLWIGPAGNLQSAFFEQCAAHSKTITDWKSVAQTQSAVAWAGVSEWLFSAETPALIVWAEALANDLNANPAKSAETLSASLMSLTQATEQVAKEPGAPAFKLWVLSQNAYAPEGSEAQPVNLAAYAPLGFAKTLALEIGDQWGGVVDLHLNPDSAEQANAVAGQLFNELQVQAGEEEVVLSAEERFCLRLQRRLANALPPTGYKAKIDGAYLISGGVGALGLQVAKALAKDGAKHLILTSRSADRSRLSTDKLALIEALEQSGVRVDLAAVDITDQAAVTALVQHYPNLAGVIHAAGISEISTLADMTSAMLHEVMHAKVAGAWALHQATAALKLDQFIVFSSIASVWGSGGLAHYAAANHFLDGLVAARRSQGLAAAAVHWGPWGSAKASDGSDLNAGMAGGEAKAEIERRGLRSLEPDAACAVLSRLMASSLDHLVVAEVDWNRFKEIIEVRRPKPMLSAFGTSLSQVGAGTGKKSAFFLSLVAKEPEQRAKEITLYLQNLMAQVLGRTDADGPVDPNAPLMDMGIDSIMALDIKKRLEADTGERIPATLIFDYPTLNRISAHFSTVLYSNASAEVSEGQLLHASNEPIAIVGIGSRLPNASEGPADFWRLLRNGESGINDSPSQRWDVDAYVDSNEEAPGKTYTLAAGLVDNLDQFDARFFGIAPREIESMEPQQRLVLEASYAALENAGMPPASLSGSNTGVFVGVGANEYVQAAAAQIKQEDIMFLPTGNALNVIAGRVAFMFGLQGPCMAIDTACSSSAVAIHNACQSLRNGECDMALAGGVNAMVLPETFIALSKAHMLSKAGRCKTFDESADGYVRGEGVGVVVLKRLSEAQRDGDNILAVIRGSAINQDGRSSSLTAPNGPAQQAVIRSALRAANATADEVDWVEAHGTATPLGDPIEVQSVEAVYSHSRSAENPLILSSVKTNLGHLESAAGVSSVMKAALSLYHEYIPPHLNFKKLNPHIAVDASKLRIPVEGFEWPRSERKRLAGVSSFGFSGTNVHMVLEEPPLRAQPNNAIDRASHVLTLSAKNEVSLSALCKRYAAFAENDMLNRPHASLADISYTSHVGRDHFAHRVAIVATDKAQLAAKLQQAAEGIDSVGVVYGTAKATVPNTAFLFTGQGAQYDGMGKTLYETDPSFQADMDRCDTLLKQEIGVSLLDILWGEKAELINDTQFTQPAIFCLEYCVAQLWLRWGVSASAFIGHSVGEYAAAVLAGIFSLEDGLKLIAARGRLMAERVERGSMAAVFAPRAEVEPLIQGKGCISVAAFNAPKNTVISGETAVVEKVLEGLETRGIEFKRLVVSHAFHSPMMQPMLEEFAEIARSISYQPAQLDIYSSVTGQLNTGDMSKASYWIDHVSACVNFHDAFRALTAKGFDVALEVGPHNTLVELGKLCAPEASGKVWLPSLRLKQDASRQVMLALAGLYTAGVSIDWKAVDAPYQRLKVALPSYAFDRKRFWLADARPSAARALAAHFGGGSRSGKMLEMRTSPMSDDIWFENIFSDKTPFALDDHKLYEAVVAPGAFHVSMATLCAKEVFGNAHYLLDDVVFPEPLLFNEGEQRTLHYAFKKQDDKNGKPSFEVKGFTRNIEDQSKSRWTMHTSMQASLTDAPESELKLTAEDLEAIQKRATHFVEGEQFYGEMWKLGYHLGSQFRWIDKIWRRSGEALTKLRLPTADEKAYPFLIHPGLMDSCFQSSAMAAAMDEIDLEKVDAIYIPFAVENLRFFNAPTTELWCHVQITSPAEVNGKQAESFTHSIQVFDDQGNVLIDIAALHSKRAPKEVLLKALKRDPFENQYEVRWAENAAPAPQAETLPGKYLLVSEDEVLVSGLTESMQAKQATLLQVVAKAGLDYQQTGNGFQLDPSNNAHWGSLLGAVGGPAGIKGILYQSPLSANSNPAEPILDAELRQFDGVLTLVKMLQMNAGTGMPRIWCITRGAVAAQRADNKVDPRQTALLGFGKVMDLEHPEFNPVLIDLDPTDNSFDASAIGAELAQPGTEKLVAFRRDKRLVARLSKAANMRSTKMEIPAEPYRLVIEQKGMFDDMKFVNFETRILGSTEVAVKVLVAGLNFRDVMGVLNVYPGDAGPIGGECIGEVIRVGDSVTRCKLGDRIMLPLAASCMSSETVADELLICKVPENLSLYEAATIPVVYSTAMYALETLAQLKKGERVLIHAGAGGVGIAAINLAKKAGAEIFATASEKKRGFLKQLGVDHVLDSRSLSFADEIKRITNGEGVNVVLNSLAGDFISTSMALLAPGGRFIEIGKADIWSQERVKAFRDDISYQSFDLVTVTMQDPLALVKLMDEIVADVEAGRIKPLPYTVYSYGEAIDAFRFMAQGKHIGKILLTPEASPMQIRNDRSYLITGASGGLGLLFAKWLAAQGAGELVLVGRRDVRTVAAADVAAIEALGTQVTCFAGDIGSETDVAALFEQLDSGSKPLAGVLHAAGVLADAFIVNQSMDSFMKVMAPKLAGAWYLHQHTVQRPLDFFVLFSSLSSFLGAPGQSNYAAANAFLDGLAQHRRALGMPATAINWGPWAEVGMAANEKVQANAATSGVLYIKPEEGLAQFELAMQENPVQRGIMPIDWQTLAGHFQAGMPAFLSELHIKVSSALDANLQKMADEFRAQLADAPLNDRTPMLVDMICEQIKRVMGLEANDTIDPNQPLQELGLDSLMAVELRNILCALIGKQLPATLMFKYPTVASLSSFLVQDMFPTDYAEAAEEAAAAAAPAPVEPEQDELEDLSQEELERLLSEELGDA